MKTTLTIISFEPKVTKMGKPYWRFNTNEGWLSCFDSVVSEQLKLKINQNVVVEKQEKDNFKNITKIYDEVVVDKVMITPNYPNYITAENKHLTMYVSYAKDIFINIIDTEQAKGIEPAGVMKLSTDLVKQAMKELS